MRKFTLSLIVSLALSACGGGGGSTTTTTTTNACLDQYNLVAATATHIDDECSIDFDGVGGTLNIEAGLHILTLTIDGTNSLVNIGQGVTVDSCLLGGVDNTVITDINLPVTCTDSGMGNQVIKQ